MKMFAKRLAVFGAMSVGVAAIACTGSAEGNVPPTISPDIFEPIPTPRPFGAITTPTPTPFAVPTVDLFPTTPATATPAPVPATPTASAPGPTATPVALPSATATPLPTEEPTATPTPEPMPEPTATPTPTPIPSAPGSVVFDPEEDPSIVLDAANARPEFVSTGEALSDFSAFAEFDNPVDFSFRDFSYGIKFRESESGYHVIAINSLGQLRYITGTPSESPGQPDNFNVVQVFNYNGVRTAGSETNSIRLAVADDEAWLYINGEYLTKFTVGGVGVASEVQFVSELENETQISGAVTRLIAPEVRSAGIADSIDDLTFIKVEGEISRTTATGVARDFVIDADFVSPYEFILAKWSAGIEFYDPVSETTSWILINNNRQWKHLRQIGAAGPVEEIDAGLHNGILRDRDDINHIRIVSHNGIHQLWINQSLIGTVDLQSEISPVQINAFTGFGPGDQEDGFPTQMLNYKVWTFGS